MSAVPDPAAENKKRASDLAVEVAKQFLAIALGAIAFTIGISSQDGSILHSLNFWVVVVLFFLSAVLGFFFLMHGVSKLASGAPFEPYGGLARSLALFQAILLTIGIGALLRLQFDSVTRSGDARLQIEQSAKGTHVSIGLGRKAVISISEKGKVEATVE